MRAFNISGAAAISFALASLSLCPRGMNATAVIGLAEAIASFMSLLGTMLHGPGVCFVFIINVFG